MPARLEQPLTLDWIYGKVSAATPPKVRGDIIFEAIAKASENLLAKPDLPGDWFGEQIALEAIRILTANAKAE